MAIFLSPQTREKGVYTLKSYTFYEELLREQGLTSYKVAMKAGVPQSAFTLWKKGAIRPKWDRMEKIAAALSTEDRPLTAADFFRLDEEEQERR